MTSIDSPVPDRPVAVTAPVHPVGGDRARVAVIVLGSLLAVLSVLVAAQGVGAQGGREGVRLVAVQFDLAEAGGTDAAGPLRPAQATEAVRYEAVQIEDRGTARRLRPIAGTVHVSLAAEDARSVVAERDGLRIGPSADGFANSLAEAVASPSLHRFVRIDTGSADTWAAIDVVFDRPLAEGHYLLVQEAGGDGTIEVEPLGADGAPAGPVQRFAAPYVWNTGHGAEAGVDHWATVAAGPTPVDGRVVTGLRIRATRAELKVVVLEPAAGGAVAGAVAAAGTDEVEADDRADGAGEPAADGEGETTRPDDGGAGNQATGQPSATAAAGALRIDLAAAVMPAVAVAGAGCDQALAGGDPPAQGPSAATFCYAVTNAGDVGVAEVAITDPRAGLTEARLPRVSGPEILQPGQRAVFYHHTTPVGGPDRVTIRAAARSVAEGDGRLADVSASVAGPTPVEAAPAVPAVEAAPAPEGRADGGQPPDGSPATEAAAPATEVAVGAPVAELVQTGQTALAMTGTATEPWVLVGLATGLIFFGYTAVAAFRRPGAHQAAEGEVSGHTQLDALGFD
jgi:hypothetical protein